MCRGRLSRFPVREVCLNRDRVGGRAGADCCERYRHPSNEGQRMAEDIVAGTQGIPTRHSGIFEKGARNGPGLFFMRASVAPMLFAFFSKKF